MRALSVMVVDPTGDHVIGLVEGDEDLLPDAILQAPLEPFDHAILLRRVGRDVLLLKLVLRDGLVESLGSEYQSIVRPNSRSGRSRHHEFANERIFERTGRNTRLARS